MVKQGRGNGIKLGLLCRFCSLRLNESNHQRKKCINTVKHFFLFLGSVPRYSGQIAHEASSFQQSLLLLSQQSSLRLLAYCLVCIHSCGVVNNGRRGQKHQEMVKKELGSGLVEKCSVFAEAKLFFGK